MVAELIAESFIYDYKPQNPALKMVRASRIAGRLISKAEFKLSGLDEWLEYDCDDMYENAEEIKKIRKKAYLYGYATAFKDTSATDADRDIKIVNHIDFQEPEILYSKKTQRVSNRL